MFLACAVIPLYLGSLLLGLSNGSSIVSWVFMELNTISLIVFLFVLEVNQASQMKYYIIQVVSSSLLLLSFFIMLKYSGLGESLGMLCLLLKLGAVPFHQWLVNILQCCGPFIFMLLGVVQKLFPMYFMYNLYDFSWGFSVFLGINALVSGLMIMWASSLSEILAYSSIFNLSWILASMGNLSSFFMFMVCYSLSLLVVITYVKMPAKGVHSRAKFLPGKDASRYTLFLGILSLGGVPPLLGFLGKLAVLETLLGIQYYGLGLVLMAFSALVLSSYLHGFWDVLVLTPFSFIFTNSFSSENLVYGMLLCTPLFLLFV